MKKLMFTICCCFALMLATAQDLTNPQVSSKKFQFFAGPTFEMGLATDDGFTYGVIGGVNYRQFSFGAYAMQGHYGAARDVTSRFDKSFNLGGAVMAFTFPAQEEVHLYGSLKTGIGTAMLTRQGEKSVEYSDQIFAVNPEIGMEINVTSYLRFALTGSYRMVYGVNELPNLNNKDFEDYSVGITFRFGRFGQ